MPRVYPPLEGKEPTATLAPSLVEWTAGFTAGVVTTLVVHPLDVIKTRIQLDQHAKVRIGNTWQVVRQIANEGSYRGHGRTKTFAQVVPSFYRGLMPNMIGNSSSWAMYFVFYGRAKEKVANARGLEGKDREKLSLVDYSLAAGASGALTALLTNPIWVIKTRMLSTARNTPGAYTSVREGFMSILRTEGGRGFYRGLLPSLIGVSHGSIQFMTYEALKNRRGMSRAGGKDGLTNLDFISLSAASKMFAGSITYPYQVLRSRLQTYDAQTKYKGVRDVIRQVYRHEGWPGFFKGLGPNLIRVLPSTCVTFLVYENVKFYMPRMLEPKDEMILNLDSE